MLEWFRADTKAKELIDAIRAEPDKDRRSELKKTLHAVVFGSEPQIARNSAACVANGILCLDFDDIPLDKLESARQVIAALPYVFAVSLSASGNGLFALIAYEGTTDLKKLIDTLQSDFPYEIDKSGSDLCRLRFLTFDPALIVKDEVFPLILTEQRGLIEDAEPLGEIVPCGVEALDNILDDIEPIDWEPFYTAGPRGETKPPSQKVYILRTVEQILCTADGKNTPLVNHAGIIYYYTGTHYKLVNEGELRNFLIEGAVRCAVPYDTAVFQDFVDKIVKQFLILASRHNSGASKPDTSFINLRNVTLFIDKNGLHFEEHSSHRFIQYCLSFDYDPKATAPLWQKHLDRSLPNPEKQRYVAMCLALAFYRGKIEKAPVFYGERDTGKSTSLDVAKALYGSENVTAETLAALTKDDYQGLYARGRLDGTLVNIASDISAKISDDGMAKMLISREKVPARHPYGKGFDIENYARLIFAMNNLPHQFFTDGALTKRVALVHFDQQIRPEDIDTNFTENIIEDELPGVLNWVIGGLDELLRTGRLDPPPCCIEAMENLRTELDPLSAWLAEKGYQKGKTHHIKIKEAYPAFVEFCKIDGYQALSKKTFTKRLRDLGYEVSAKNNHIGLVLWYTRSVPAFRSPHSPHSPSLENKDETGEQAGSDGEQSGDTSKPCTDSLPVQSRLTPASDPTNTGLGSVGSDGSENSEQISAPATIEYRPPRTGSAGQ